MNEDLLCVLEAVACRDINAAQYHLVLLCDDETFELPPVFKAWAAHIASVRKSGPGPEQEPEPGTVTVPEKNESADDVITSEGVTDADKAVDVSLNGPEAGSETEPGNAEDVSEPGLDEVISTAEDEVVSGPETVNEKVPVVSDDGSEKDVGIDAGQIAEVGAEHVEAADSAPEPELWFDSVDMVSDSDRGFDPYMLSGEVSRLLVFENVVDTFNPARYWLSEREKVMLADILSQNRACAMLAGANIPFLNATLLWGQSGTGKTEFGRYVAYTLRLPFAYVNLCNFVGSSLGETGRNLQVIFDFIQQAPCVLMLDELDAIGCNRGSIGTGGSGDEMTRTTIALMQCMDRVRRDVVLLAATNRKDMLDNAVLRRFTAVHELVPFKPEDAFEMVKSYLTDVKKTGNLDFSWNDEDIRTQCTIGRAQAELINLCNRGIVRAMQTDGIVRMAEEDKRARKNKWR